MNQILEALDTFSGSTAQQLATHIPELPLFLLDVAVRRTPLLAQRREAIAAVRQHIDERNLADGLWNDPEIYYPLLSLSDQVRELEDADRLLRLLRVYLGLDPLESAEVPDGFYRLTRLKNAVFYREGESVRQLDDNDMYLPADGGPRVYLPVPGLFSDILNPDIRNPGVASVDAYANIYSTSEAGADMQLAADRYREALALIATFEEGAVADFCHIVNTVVLLPPVGSPALTSEMVVNAPFAATRDDPALRWSFNMRFRYYGAVFVNPFSVDAFGLAEGLIHEYLHQRIWLWWQLEQPTGIPAMPGTPVRSPVTEAVREGAVLMQAVTIYASAIEFYRYFESRGLPMSEWARRRRALLEKALPILAERILKVIPGDSHMARMVEEVVARVFPDGATNQAARL